LASRKGSRKGRKSERVTARIPSGLYRRILEVCKNEGYDIATFLRAAIELCLRDLEQRQSHSADDSDKDIEGSRRVR